MNAACSEADIAGQLDQLPLNRRFWSLLGKVSLGGFFEVYDLALTALLSPLLVQAGVFHSGSGGLFGLPDQASFAFVTMLGLYVGSLAFSAWGDRCSRRSALVWSMLAYSAASLLIGLQHSVPAMLVWRFVAGIGLGVELVIVDCYLLEMTPKPQRGKIFSISKAIQLSAIPVAGGLAHAVGVHSLWGIAGWRWLVAWPALGALAMALLRRGMPDSPLWLAGQGRLPEAAAVLAWLRGAAASSAPITGQLVEHGQPITEVAMRPRYRDLLVAPYRRRVLMLLLATPASSIAFYGFAHWAPTLLEDQGVTITHSLLYTALIGLAYPLSPLLATSFADRVERKWQIIVSSIAVAGLGLAFAHQSRPAMWIAVGVLLTLASEINSTAAHTYRSELFPTRLRAKAVGLVYSFDRLGTAFSSYLIASILLLGGVPAVFWFLASIMALCGAVTWWLGPLTLARRDLPIG